MNNEDNFDIQRRKALQKMTGLGMGSMLLSALPSSLLAQSVSSDYRALVCLFSLGGMDHNDTILPYDQAQYDQLRSVRQGLFSSYSSLGSGASRSLESLLPLNPSDQLATEGRRYAVPSELGPLRELFDAEELAFIGSVGALVEPTDRDSFENRSVAIPPSLFSHNDQQNYWQGLAPEGAKAGWGGRFMDSLNQRGLVGDERFGAISTVPNPLFVASDQLPNYFISKNGPTGIELETRSRLLGRGAEMNAVRARLSEWFRADFQNGSLLEKDVQQVQREAILAADDYRLEFSSAPQFNTTFPASGYGPQLANVAKAIRISSAFGMQRQIFFVGVGGFDTHKDQAERLPGKQAEIANSVKAFRDAMKEVGMWNNVTLFSAADFGRTMIENGSGTDHGWGGHHFVTGGGVRGGRMLGRFPEYDTNGAEYTKSRARLIPSVSIEQYSASLGDWFGVEPGAIDAILPNLANFGNRRLDLFKS